jgi:hypothetical protein
MVMLARLQQPCARCGHQNAVHVGGRDPTGWPIYDPVWSGATGWCVSPGCSCPARTDSPQSLNTPERARNTAANPPRQPAASAPAHLPNPNQQEGTHP